MSLLVHTQAMAGYRVLVNQESQSEISSGRHSETQTLRACIYSSTSKLDDKLGFFCIVYGTVFRGYRADIV